MREESSMGPSYVDTSDGGHMRNMIPKMKHMQGSGSMNLLHQDRELNSKRHSSKPLSITESKKPTLRDNDEERRKNYVSPRPLKDELKGMKVVVKTGKEHTQGETINYQKPVPRHRTIRSPSDSPRESYSSISSDEEYSKENA